MAIKPVELAESYRFLNLGPTVLVSAKAHGVENVMSCAWNMPVEYDQMQVSLGKQSYTRRLVEESGFFVINVPTKQLIAQVLAVGSESYADNPHKLDTVKFFHQPEFDLPLVEGAAAWLVCRLRSNPAVQEAHDLFLGDVVAAWADDRVFRDGHWHFEDAPDALRTIHYIAGGQFYVIGDSVNYSK